MRALEALDEHLKNRLADLRTAKEQGRRVIGYSAGGYLPEELVLACDGIPICFVQAGDNAVLKDAGRYLCRWIDPFWRSQIGYLTSGKDPYYTLADLIVVPITDNHTRAFSNTLGFYTPERESFVFGVPHTKDEFAFEYYLQGIKRLKKKLEDFTGVEITEARLKKSIRLCNRERELLKTISMMRRSERLPVTGKDVVALHHASFIADKEVMVDVLESFVLELKQAAPVAGDGSRILLTGGTMARGDTTVMEIIEETGGVLVMEEFAEGMRPYWKNVTLEGDLMANLAECYFMDRVCPGWFRPGTERLDFLVKLAGEYNAAGLVWYHLMFRESYKVESYFFPKILKKEAGIPMLVLESEYDAMDTGPMRTRIETFIDTLKR